MTEPSAQAGAGDPRTPHDQSVSTTPGVHIRSPHVVPQGSAQPTAAGQHDAAAPVGRAAPAGAGHQNDGRAAPPPEDLFSGAPPEDAAPNRRRNLLACGGCLLLALVLALGAFLAYQWLKPEEGGYSRPETPTAQQPEEDGGNGGDPSEEEPAEDVSPAPEGAAEMPALVSPSGNIHCILDGDSVSCSMGDHQLGDIENGCDTDEAFGVRVGAEGDPQVECGETFQDGDAQELAYGESARNGNVACTSERDGMTCWNTRTGKGFIIARDTYETL